jgi:hypothetical protein
MQEQKQSFMELAKQAIRMQVIYSKDIGTDVIQDT